MVRTRDGGARKAVAAKAPRKVLASSGGGGVGGLGSPSGKVNKYAGGNAYCPRPTPEWQKGIGAFIVKKPAPAEKENSEPMEDGTEAVATPASSSAAQGSSASSSSSSSAAEGSSQGSSSSSSSSEPTSSSSSQPEPSSPIKKNGLISDSDDDE